MAQRHSEYPLKENQTYVTPKWVWDELYTVEPWARLSFDCAPEKPEFDFLADDYLPPSDWLATNPPYGREAVKFVRKALEVAERVAMLLPHGWDSAKGRRDLFEDAPFKAKYTILRRIHWDNIDHKLDKNGKPIEPSGVHAWYVWDKVDFGHEFRAPPTMAWLPLTNEGGV